MSTNDKCMRAAQAAVEVVREECGDRDIDVREVEEGMFIEIPTEDAERVDDLSETPVTLEDFKEMIMASGFMRRWIHGVVASNNTDADPDSAEYASAVHNLAGSLFDNDLQFTPSDLVGTQVLEDISRAE